MLFQETGLKGAWVIEVAPASDHRGFFARTFCTREFQDYGLETCFSQHSLSVSRQKGTLRGMHFQVAPHEEVKVVTCHRGAIWDVIIDLRPESPTFRRWEAFELSQANHRRLYIPRGFAHGFQTLSPAVEVGYLISTPYVPHAASGVRYNDPAFAIEWPLPISAISEKDESWPNFA
jgi:dTDP-4-dehydrorhamnose 3,5-epimerase